MDLRFPFWGGSPLLTISHTPPPACSPRIRHPFAFHGFALYLTGNTKKPSHTLSFPTPLERGKRGICYLVIWVSFTHTHTPTFPFACHTHTCTAQDKSSLFPGIRFALQPSSDPGHTHFPGSHTICPPLHRLNTSPKRKEGRRFAQPPPLPSHQFYKLFLPGFVSHACCQQREKKERGMPYPLPYTPSLKG